MRNENVVCATNHLSHMVTHLVSDGCTILSVFVDRHYVTDGQFAFSIQVLGDDAWSRWASRNTVTRDEQDRPVVKLLDGEVFAYELQL